MTGLKRVIGCVLIIFCLLAAVVGAYVCIGTWQDNKIEFTVNDTLPDGNGERATVILLAGQSNASGCSRDDYLKKNVSEEKYAEYENGYDNVYINYVSGFNVSSGFVKCSTLQGEMEGCFGPELGMAEKLNEMYPEQTFFIVKFAWGGTNLFEQWLSPSSSGKTGTFYRQFVAYVDANLKYLESKNYDVKIESMCWMQGESDSFSVEHATGYEEHLANLISDVRRRFRKYASDDGIAFVDAYIADLPIFWVYGDLVNESKRKVSEMSDMNVVVDTIYHGLDTTREPEDTPDIPHYDSMSEIKLGHLFAEMSSGYFD